MSETRVYPYRNTRLAANLAMFEQPSPVRHRPAHWLTRIRRDVEVDAVGGGDSEPSRTRTFEPGSFLNRCRSEYRHTLGYVKNRDGQPPEGKEGKARSNRCPQ